MADPARNPQEQHTPAGAEGILAFAAYVKEQPHGKKKEAFPHADVITAGGMLGMNTLQMEKAKLLKIEVLEGGRHRYSLYEKTVEALEAAAGKQAEKSR